MCIGTFGVVRYKNYFEGPIACQLCEQQIREIKKETNKHRSLVTFKTIFTASEATTLAKDLSCSWSLFGATIG